MSKFHRVIWVFVLALVTSSFTKKDPFPPLQEVIPVTRAEVFAVKQRIETTIQSTIDEVLSIPADEKTYENTMMPWNRMTCAFIADYGTLHYLSQANFPCKQDAEDATNELGRFFGKVLFFNADLQHSFLAYIENALCNSPGPYECHVIKSFLDTFDSLQGVLNETEKQILTDLQKRTECELLSIDEEVLLAQLTELDSIGRLSNAELATVELFKEIVATQETVPFLYNKGRAFEKQQKGSGFTVLTLNVCFSPGNLVYFHAGVMPWEQRVTGLAYQIKKIGADVVCLQEVHGEDAGLALCEKLKSDYAHFYYAIGPRPFGFSFSSCGMPSGLFIASKYPIANPQFTLFAQAGYPMNWGLFDFVIQNGTTPIGHIYTSHMQSLDFEYFPEIRAGQLQQTIEKMQDDAADQSDIPYILCGDLNIVWGSNEPAEGLLRANFYDAYNEGRTQVDACSRTCTYYYSNYFLSSTKQDIDPNFQILDYALLLKPAQNFRIRTSLVPMNDLGSPGWGLTDHHGLLTTIN